MFIRSFVFVTKGMANFDPGAIKVKQIKLHAKFGSHGPYGLEQKVILPFPKQQILDFSTLKELKDDNFKLDKYGRKFSKGVEDTGKRRNCS